MNVIVAIVIGYMERSYMMTSGALRLTRYTPSYFE